MNYITKKWIIIFIIIMCLSGILNICDLKNNNIEKFSEINSKIYEKVSDLISFRYVEGSNNNLDKSISLKDYFEDLNIEDSIRELNRKLSIKNIAFNNDTKLNVRSGKNGPETIKTGIKQME